MQDGISKDIIVDRLIKNFEVTDKKPGLVGSIKTLIKPKKKKVRALKRISFTIKSGELVGFIGPNGAGKTTTLKVLSGLLYPTSGTTYVLGHDPWERKPEFLKQIALVMGRKRQLWWDLPAVESFELNRVIYEIPRRQYKETLSELVDMLEVKKLLNIQVRRLSLGQRMRLELIAALLHKPKVLFLDEPTIGLDVVGQQRVRDFIYEYNKVDGATILLTSHNMTDLTDLAKRVIVIDKGEILYDGQLRELVTRFAKTKIIRVYLSKEADLKMVESVGKILKIDFPQVVISVPRSTAAVASAEILQNLPVADLTIEEQPIEEIVGKVFRGELLKKRRKT